MSCRLTVAALASVILAPTILTIVPAAAQTKPIVEKFGCDAADRIDGTTAETARRKLNQAGFVQVTELKKACDNFWHSRAVKDGVPVNVALSPTGQAIIEGN